MKLIHFLDLETEKISPGNVAPSPVCVSWGEGELALWEDARGILRAMLEQAIKGIAIIAAHKAAFDFACIIEHDRELAPLVWEAYERNGITCTRLRERLIAIKEGELAGRYGAEGKWEEARFDLGTLVKRRFGVELDKDPDGWRLRFGELQGLPIEQWPKRASDYARGDALWGLKLFHDQTVRAPELPTEFLEARADFALYLTSAWGVRTDERAVLEIWDRTERRANELSTMLLEGGLMVEKNFVHLQSDLFGGESAPELKKNMEAIRTEIEASWPEDLGSVPRTETGKVSTAAEVIELCSAPLLSAVVEHNAIQKTGSTYLRHLFEGFHRPIHARFDALGAASSRTSCRGPNLQNQPRLPGVRECFISRPGRVLLACDFDSQEMRTLAQSCLDVLGWSSLAEEYKRNPSFDPHQQMADEHGSTRQRAKIANFGLPGGLGVGGLIRYAKGYGVTLSANEAKELRNQWFQSRPEMELYFSHVGTLVGSAGYGTQTIPRSGFVRAGVTYTSAANGYFQTLAAHASKEALWRVVRRCFDPRLGSMLLGSRPWNFVHDEVILEVPEEAGHEAAEAMEREMVEGMSKWVPDVPCSASAHLMRRWSKKAEAVHDSSGRLVPWEA